MNEAKQKQLFDAVRRNPGIEPPINFAAHVAAAARSAGPQRRSISDELGALFPRFAAAALLVIVLCAAAEFYFESDSAADFSQAEQWFFNES